MKLSTSRYIFRSQPYKARLSITLSLCSIILASLVLGACGDNAEPTQVSPITRSPIEINYSPVATTIVSGPTATPRPVTSNIIRIEIDQTKVLHNISPLIYGLAASGDEPDYINQLRPTLMRWGGNPSTRYNWVVGNVWNTGRDGGFNNTDYDNPAEPDTILNVADEAIQSNKNDGVDIVMTIPTIGWVANGVLPRPVSRVVPAKGAAPDTPGSDKIVGYDPNANRQLTSVQSKARKGAPFVFQPNPESSVIYQDEWVAHLVKKFGRADAGGVKFYAMDNEPELWSETHTDVNPARMGYDDILNRFLEYSTAVKAVDPTAQITGPTTNGWTHYFYSELDRGNDNFQTAADRKAHDNIPFLPWFLQEVRKHDEKVGYRTLDVLDIHYYPQAPGVFGDGSDPQTDELRLNSVRSLYDANYVDESWIAQRVRLIPLMYEWINTYYPGTKLAINEWNWGADRTLNGGLAIANVLGVFGRYNLYMAAYWRYPEMNGAGFQAFKMYTNFDSNGTRFGDQSLDAKSSSPLFVTSYAAINSKTGRMQTVLINQRPDRPYTVEVALAKPISEQEASVYELSAATNERLVKKEPLKVSGNTIKITIPAYTALLLDLDPR